MKPTAFKIIANGNNITAKIADRLISLTVNDNAGINNDSVTINLDNRELAIKPPNTGAELEVYIGYADQLVFKGIYTVDEVSEPLEINTLSINAQGAKMKGSFKAQRDASYENITFSDLLNHIAKAHGYNAKIEPSLADIKFVQIDQRGESDSNLLTRLAKENSAILKVAANNLLVVPKQKGKTSTGKILQVIKIIDPENSTGSVTMTDRAEYNSVKAYWFDEALQQKKSEISGSGEPQFIIKKTHQNADTAKQSAVAKLSELQRGKSTLSLNRPLSPMIIAEGIIELSNHKKSANGKWSVETASHSIDANNVGKTTIKASVV